MRAGVKVCASGCQDMKTSYQSEQTEYHRKPADYLFSWVVLCIVVGFLLSPCRKKCNEKTKQPIALSGAGRPLFPSRGN